MSTFKNRDIMQESIGEVYVQPQGDVPPRESLFVMQHPAYGILLSDRDGVSVSPNSPRLRDAALVCEDGTDPMPLRNAGYKNVVERG